MEVEGQLNDILIGNIINNDVKDNKLSNEAIFVSKLVSYIKCNGTSENYKNLREVSDDYLYNFIPKAVKEFKDKGTPIKDPAIQLVFNLEDMLDGVYQRAKRDARIEFFTELEAVYKMKKRCDESSPDTSFSDGDNEDSIIDDYNIDNMMSVENFGKLSLNINDNINNDKKYTSSNYNFVIDDII